jgi:hypothetical protein
VVNAGEIGEASGHRFRCGDYITSSEVGSAVAPFALGCNLDIVKVPIGIPGLGKGAGQVEGVGYPQAQTSDPIPTTIPRNSDSRA